MEHIQPGSSQYIGRRKYFITKQDFLAAYEKVAGVPPCLEGGNFNIALLKELGIEVTND